MLNEQIEMLRKQGILELENASQLQLGQVINIWDLVRHTEDFHPHRDYAEAVVEYYAAAGGSQFRRIDND